MASRRNSSPPKIEIAHSSYQPTKAEKEEPMEFPKGTTPENLARALTRPVRVKYIDPRRKR